MANFNVKLFSGREVIVDIEVTVEVPELTADMFALPDDGAPSPAFDEQEVLSAAIIKSFGHKAFFHRDSDQAGYGQVFKTGYWGMVTSLTGKVRYEIESKQ